MKKSPSPATVKELSHDSYCTSKLKALDVYKRQVTELGLGAINDRSLKQARELAAKMRSAVKEGKNPAPLVKEKLDPLRCV